jgi:hypothetical protein
VERALRFGVREPQVIHETVDGEVVAVNLETGHYYSMMDSAAHVWHAVVQAATADEIRARLESVYDHANGDLGPSLDAFLEELAREGLIAPVDAARDAVDPGPAPETRRGAFEPPVLERFTDMKDLILLDPVHDVREDRGWPTPKPD